VKIFNYEPSVVSDDISSIVECLESGIAKPFHIKNAEEILTKKFKNNAIVCSSGTSAIHLALLSKNIGPGDEVICPDFTFASTWNAIIYTGAKPVFVDVCKDTWCIDPDMVEKLINKKTKAIVSVDIFGNACEYEKLNKICKKSNISLIQDSAESLGTTYKNKNVFNLGNISCTSFNLNKIVTSCGGGAIFCDNSKISTDIKKLINQNKKANTYDYEGLGFNYRMGTLNAALLSSQVSRIDKILYRKKQITEAYKDKLDKIDSITFQIETKYCKSNNWANVIKLLNKKERDDLLLILNNKGIEAKLTFTPASLVAWICDNNSFKYECLNSKNIFNTTLILPSSPSLSDEQIHVVCDEIISYYERKK
jgi:perosamine synthetase